MISMKFEYTFMGFNVNILSIFLKEKTENMMELIRLYLTWLSGHGRTNICQYTA